MKRSTHNFNKKIFSLLIETAKGDRSLRRFALDCGISYVQMRKLSAMLQENAPGKALMKKLAENSLNGIEYDDYLFAAGLSFLPDERPPKKNKQRLFEEKFESLSSNQKKTVEDFVDFLSKRK